MLKNLGLIFAFFVLLFLFAKFGPGIPFSVVNSNRTDFFSVSADGKVTAIPDVAEISLGVTTNSSTVADAQTQANTIINDITNAVKKLGIEEKDIRTTNYNIQPTYDYRSSTQRITGYSVNTNIVVKVRDFTKINNVIDQGTTFGANQVGSLNFTYDDPEKYKAQARKIAIDNARKKASDIANTAGINLGKLVNVSENYADYPRPLMALDKATGIGGGGAALTQIEPGSSEVSVTVTLSYETR